MKKSQLKAEGFLVLATLIWGGTFVVIKTGLSDTSPFLFLGIRFFLAFLLIIPFAIPRRGAINLRSLKYGLFLGIFQFLGYSLQTLGLQYTTVAKSSLLTYIYALITPLLQYAVLKKRIKKANLIGLLIVLAGILLFASPENSTLNRGDYLTLGSAFSYAFYIILLDLLTSREDPVILTSVQFLFTALVCLGLSPLLEDTYIRLTRDSLFALLYLASLGSVGAIYIMNKFQKETTPTKAVIIYALEPVFAVILGFLFLKEGLKIVEMTGAALILGGVMVSEVLGLLSDRQKR